MRLCFVQIAAGWIASHSAASLIQTREAIFRTHIVPPLKAGVYTYVYIQTCVSWRIHIYISNIPSSKYCNQDKLECAGLQGPLPILLRAPWSK